MPQSHDMGHISDVLKIGKLITMVTSVKKIGIKMYEEKRDEN